MKNRIDYSVYYLMIYKLALKYHRKYNFIEFEEIVSEGNLIFARCAKTYKEGKAKFSTYLYRALSYELFRFCVKRFEINSKEVFVEDDFLSFFKPDYCVEDACIEKLDFEDMREGLSPRSQMVVDTAIYPPEDLIDQIHNTAQTHKKITRAGLLRYFKSKDYAVCEIKNSFAEIQNKIFDYNNI